MLNQSKKATADKTKENLKNNPHEPLSTESTIPIRLYRGHPASPPLQASGRLLSGIREVKKGISIHGYGLRHDEGFISGGMIPGKKVPARPFIEWNAVLSKELLNNFWNSLMRKFRK